MLSIWRVAMRSHVRVAVNHVKKGFDTSVDVLMFIWGGCCEYISWGPSPG